MTQTSQPRALLAASVWWPLSARLALALIENGWSIAALCPPGHPLRFIPGISRYFAYHRLNSLQSLKRAIEQADPDLVIPCDDGVVWQLHHLHATVPALRPLLERSLGNPASFPILRSRAQILELASTLGIRIPKTRIVHSPHDLTPIALPAVLKLDGTWGGNGVRIVHSTSEALSGFDRFNRPPTPSVAWKRLLIDHDPLARWMSGQLEHPQITVQQLIPGRPVNTMIVAVCGEVLAHLTVEVLCAHGPTGAATIVRVIDLPEVTDAACELARHLGITGFYGLDFILDNRTGAAFFIELNPRCTQLGHLAVGGNGSLAAHLATLLGQPRQPSVASPEHRAIAFFPQAVNLNPRNPLFLNAIHDVPWQHPALVRCLLSPQWPQRQLLARLYHSFRPPTPQPEVCFAL